LAAILVGCRDEKPVPFVEVTSPSGSEIWYFQGPAQEITWASYSIHGNVDIHYTTDSAAAPVVWVAIATDVPNSGSYLWTIPDANSARCRVRVRETGGGGLADESDIDFRLAPPALTLAWPTGGEMLPVGSAQLISWTGGGFADLEIEMSRDRGSTWGVLSPSVAVEEGSFAWTVDTGAGGLPQQHCVVRVSAVGEPALADASGEFTICSGTVWFVDADAAAGGDGTSWTLALQHPQLAMDAAAAGDEVWVAEGVYHRRHWSDETVLVMKSGILTFGGFAGTETALNERDWGLHQTTLDGATLVDHVVVGASSARLDGFTVTGGYAWAGFLDPDGFGGGMYNAWRTGLCVANCTFLDNFAEWDGGAISNDACSDLSILDCVFEQNTAEDDGGAISNDSTTVVITSCSFVLNAADQLGGAIYTNYGSFEEISDCTFTSNTALYGSGGGIEARGDSTTILDACSFENNSANGRGGGVCCFGGVTDVTACIFTGNQGKSGGGLSKLEDALTVTDCSFFGNAATDYGGGIYVGQGNSHNIKGCSFSGNTAAMRGGGVCIWDGSVTSLSNCRFANNTADSGGGMYSLAPDGNVASCVFLENDSAVDGGAVFNDITYGSEGLSFVNCTIWGNTALRRGGGVCNSHASSRFTNCIIWGNVAAEAPGLHDYASNCTVAHSCLQGGRPGTGNFAADPSFVNEATADLRLRGASPCIDAAEGDAAPNLDFVGNGRHNDVGMPDAGVGTPAYADVGAYEFQGTTTAADIAVVTPASTAVWRVGGEVRIKWVAGGGISSLKIELSRDGGSTWETIEAAAPNTREYLWTVTDGAEPLPQTDCRVRISDQSDGDPVAVSGGFTIGSGVWYVDVDAPPGGNGFSWASAFNHPQDAADVAWADDEIRTAGGTYLRRAVGDTGVLNMASGVRFLGGFAGLGEPSPDDRSPLLYPAILDGEGACTHVVVGAPNGFLDGFTVTGGQWQSTDWPANQGAGMFCYHAPNLRISNSVFRGNSGRYGGALALRYSLATVSGCSFQDNSAVYDGCISSLDSDVAAERCIFTSNVAGNRGGAAFVARGSVLFANCIFTGNSANYGGAMFGYGLPGPTVDNCTFHGNVAHFQGSSICNNNDSSPMVTNCIMWGESAPDDIEVFSFSGWPTVAYCCVEGGHVGTGNINADPLFVLSGYWHDNGTPVDPADDYWVEGDYHLQVVSPCVDTGDPATTLLEDIEGSARPLGSGFDIGAYEQ
jgi:predicted outer membrane repeat protein